ncbi:hypothetical protein THICB2_640134 [Thiomonas sp. CB2]|nr:hypothetical protein THICB2_640134 [Thiomonas sp. CB2]
MGLWNCRNGLDGFYLPQCTDLWSDKQKASTPLNSIRKSVGGV